MVQPPVLDLNDRSFLEGLDRACREWGFFYLEGHGVDPTLCSKLLSTSRQFFALPSSDKRRIERTKTNAWGFYDKELTKNRRDWKEIFDVGPAEDHGPLAGASPQWPRDHRFRETLEAFYRASTNLSLELVRHVLDAFGRADQPIDTGFRDHTSFLRLNFYPECPNPAPANASDAPESGELGISHHTDSGALTVLLQDDVAALQVLHQGEWVTITPRQGTFIINVGDVIQVLTNDAYPAPLHRVLVSTDRDRVSAAYFFNPAYAMDYAPLVEPARYAPINWGEFRAARADGDYGQEIQIGDYAI